MEPTMLQSFRSKLDQIVRCLLILGFLATLRATAVAQDHRRLSGLDELRNQVIKLEKKLNAIQTSDNKDRTTGEIDARINLAEARGRLAFAEGRLDDAVQEFTDLVAGRKKAIAVYLKTRCGCLEELQQLQKELAYARAQLAEVKFDPKELAVELNKALALQENLIQMYHRLFQLGGCNPEQVIAAQKELIIIRSQLDRAKRLIRKKELLDGGIS